MRYSFISAAVAALVSTVAAQTPGFDAITSPTQDQKIPAGSSFDIVWEPSGVSGTVTISLLQGATFNTLQVGPVIASSIQNSLGTYTYTIPSTSSFATYGFQITLDSTAKDPNPEFQYSKPFHIVGGSASGSGSSSGSASATGSGSSSRGSTTTVQLSQGPSFTSSTMSTSTFVSTSSSVASTKVVTTSSSSSSGSATLAPVSSSSGSSSGSTTLHTSSTTTSSGSSSTSSASPAASSNAAMSNIATGGMAMVGGVVLALAL